mgnify:CR=1 FL=1
MSGAVVQPDTGELTVLFTKPEAEAATAKLKSYFGVSCQLVKELHDKQAWKAMGYGSWAAYTKAEFDISRSRSYQLIKYAEVVAGLASVAQVPMDDMAAVLSEGAARAITPAEIAEVSTNVDTSADDRAEVAASAAVAAARARREAEAQKPPEPEPVACSVTDCPDHAIGDLGFCPWHHGKFLADVERDAAAKKPVPDEEPPPSSDEPQQVPAPAAPAPQQDPPPAAGTPEGTPTPAAPGVVDEDLTEDGTGQPAPQPVGGPEDTQPPAPTSPETELAAVTREMASTWIAAATYLLRISVGTPLTDDDAADLRDVRTHIDALLADQEQN